MKQVAVINPDKSAGDSLISLNLELKTGKRQRSMELYPEFEVLLKQLSSDTLRFPFAAFSDDTVLEADFTDKQLWEGGTGNEDGPLCNKLLEYENTGQRFYTKLEALLDSTGNAELVEAYHLCLVCGFQGKFYDNPKSRQRYIDRAALYLREHGRLRDTFLPEDKEEPEPPSTESPLWRRWQSLNKGWLLAWFIAFLLLKLTLLIFYVRPAMRELVK